jgi:hypothetical protein
MHHEVNLVSSVGYTWYGYNVFIPVLGICSQLGCFRNGLRVILYFILLELQDASCSNCCFCRPSFLHPLFLTFSSLISSRSNIRQGNNWNTCVFWSSPFSLYFLYLFSAFFFILPMPSILVCSLRLCSFIRRRRNKGLLEFLEASVPVGRANHSFWTWP